MAVFHGWPAAGITGITEATPHAVQPLGTDYVDYPTRVAHAVEVLRTAGIAGPYGLALGPEGYTGVVETTEHGGITVFDHLRQVLDGPIVVGPRGVGSGGGESAGRGLLVRVGPGPLDRLLTC